MSAKNETTNLTNARVDRTAFSVSTDVSDREATLWWHRQTPEARLRHLMELRKLNYGDRATGRIQRVLEIIERTSS